MEIGACCKQKNKILSVLPHQQIMQLMPSQRYVSLSIFKDTLTNSLVEGTVCRAKDISDCSVEQWLYQVVSYSTTIFEYGDC